MVPKLQTFRPIRTSSVLFISPKAEMAAHNFILKGILSDDEKNLWYGKKPLCGVVEMKIKKAHAWVTWKILAIETGDFHVPF